MQDDLAADARSTPAQVQLTEQFNVVKQSNGANMEFHKFQDENNKIAEKSGTHVFLPLKVIFKQPHILSITLN